MIFCKICLKVAFPKRNPCKIYTLDYFSKIVPNFIFKRISLLNLKAISCLVQIIFKAISYVNLRAVSELVGIVPGKFPRNFVYILRSKRLIFSLKRKKKRKNERTKERNKEVTEVKEWIGKGGKEE